MERHARAFVEAVRSEALYGLALKAQKMRVGTEWNEEAVRQGLRRTAKRGRLDPKDFAESVSQVVIEAKGRLAQYNRRQAEAREKRHAEELSWASFPRHRGNSSSGDVTGPR